MKQLFTVLLCLLFSISSLAQNNFNTKKMDSLIAAVDANKKAMGQLTLSKKGKPVYQKAWGYKSIEGEKKLPADVHTKYRIGSISKMFTAVMIFQLIESNKLSLTTPLATFFPKVPNAEKITIAQMLHHHSGLHSFTDDADYLDYNTKPHTRAALLEKINSSKPEFQPGEKGEYSNSNFVLLGYIIEDLTKQTYAQALQKMIAQKTGLTETYYGTPISASKNEAASFEFAGKQWVKQPETDMSVPGGAGAVVSTTQDLTKFIEALFAGKLISKNHLDEMMNIEDGYGAGMFRLPFGKKWGYGHTGGIDGFNSMLLYFPDDSLAMAYTGNGLNYELNDIIIGVLSIAFDQPYMLPTFETVDVDVAILKSYAGNYASKTLPLKIKVWEENGTLMAQATGQGAFPLDATDDSTFRFDAAGIEMKFNQQKAGSFTLKQGGGSFVFERE